MGSCCSSAAVATIPIGKFGPVLSQGEIDLILMKNGIQVGCYYTDDNYNTLNSKDLVRVANATCVMVNDYKIESADCDDRALIMLGRMREHYGRGKSDFGTCFGYVHGDLRLLPGDGERMHAVNWFISEDKRLFVYDPMWNESYPWTPSMKAFVMLL